MFELGAGVGKIVHMAVERCAGKIDDEVGVFEGFAGERFGMEMDDWVIAGDQGLLGEGGFPL